MYLYLKKTIAKIISGTLDIDMPWMMQEKKVEKMMTKAEVEKVF